MRVGFFCSWIPPTNTLLERLLILAEELKYVIHTGIFFPTEFRKVAFTHPTYCLIYFLGGGGELSIISQLNLTPLVMIFFYYLEVKSIIYLTSNYLGKSRIVTKVKPSIAS